MEWGCHYNIFLCHMSHKLFRPHLSTSYCYMRSIATDGVTWSVGLLSVCHSVCRSVTIVSLQKRPNQSWCRWECWCWPIHGSSPCEREILRRKVAADCKIGNLRHEVCKKRLNPSRCSLRCTVGCQGTLQAIRRADNPWEGHFWELGCEIWSSIDASTWVRSSILGT